MDVKKKCEIAETIGELVLGGAMGVLSAKAMDTVCENTFEKVLVASGAVVGSWMTGRAFAKQFYKFCNAAFNTDFDTKYL